MKISKVLLSIRWQKPVGNLASDFQAVTVDRHSLPGFAKGFSLTGKEHLGAGTTVFILPDGRVHTEFAGTIQSLFDVVSKSDTVHLIGSDEIQAWVFVDGEIVMRGMITKECWAYHRADDGKMITDDPDHVIVLDSIRFLSSDEMKDLLKILEDKQT